MEDGRVLGLYQRERFTRVKRQAFVPAQFIRDCLKWSGVRWNDVDFLAVTNSQSRPLILLEPDEFHLQHSTASMEALKLRGLDRATGQRLMHELQRRVEFSLRRFSGFLENQHAYGEYFGDSLINAADRSTAIPSLEWAVSPPWWRDEATPGR